MQEEAAPQGQRVEGRGADAVGGDVAVAEDQLALAVEELRIGVTRAVGRDRVAPLLEQPAHCRISVLQPVQADGDWAEAVAAHQLVDRPGVLLEVSEQLLLLPAVEGEDEQAARWRLRGQSGERRQVEEGGAQWRGAGQAGLPAALQVAPGPDQLEPGLGEVALRQPEPRVPAMLQPARDVGVLPHPAVAPQDIGVTIVAAVTDHLLWPRRGSTRRPAAGRPRERYRRRRRPPLWPGPGRCGQ